MDPKYWHENMQLLKNTKSPFDRKNPRHVLGTEIHLTEDSNPDKFTSFLGLEMEDFMHSKGQWDVEIKPRNFAEAYLQDKKFADMDEKPPIEEIEEIYNNDKTSHGPINNHLFGDIMESLIEKIYPYKEEKKDIDYPQFLPVKISIIGRSHSGRSTIGQFLNQKYDVDIINIEELVKDGITKWGCPDDSFYEDEEEPNYFGSDQEIFGKDDRDQKPFTMGTVLDNIDNQDNVLGSDDKVPEVDANGNHLEAQNQSGDGGNANQENLQNTQSNINLEKQEEQFSVNQSNITENGSIRRWCPLKSLIRRVYNGEEVDDSLYVLLIIEQLQKLYPKMSPKQYLDKALEEKKLKIQEMMAHMGPADVNKDKLSIFKKQKVMSTQEKMANIDESSIPLINSQGFILMDFPNSYNQAKLLEQAFTSFITDDQKESHISHLKLQELKRLVKPSPKDIKPKELCKSGLD